MHSFIVCTRATGRGCLVRKGFPKPNFKIAIQPPNTHVKKKKKKDQLLGQLRGGAQKLPGAVQEVNPSR